MRIDPDGRALHGLSTFLAFVALNVVYLITCLPIITIGVATSALYEVTMRYADDEQGRLLRDYFVALKHNLLPATIVLFALGVPCGFLAFSGLFWMSYDSAVSIVAAILSLLGAAYLLAATLYGLALVAAFRNTVRQTLKNALLLPGAEPARTLGVVVIPITAVCLVILFPPFGLLIATIGFSVGAYATAFLFRSVFGRHT